MGDRPRLLTIMGSGETAPTMVKVHRGLIDRVGPSAVLLDTPFGFQANADDLVAKAQAYFRDSVGTEIAAASFRSAASCSGLDLERALNRVRAASYVFAGPGSPTYALRHWSGSPVVDVLRDKLEQGGAITFASAAALTLGVATVPVYEIYKSGEDPRWLPGLDLLSATGLRAAVVPHYNNAEGGHHDTRFCYLGESRLAAMERDLPEDAFVLGVDEHTALTFDLDAGTATVHGLGVVTVRVRGHSTELAAGTEVAISDLHSAGTPAGAVPAVPVASAAIVDVPRSPLLDVVHSCEAEFAAALADRVVPRAVAALLELEAEIDAWSHDSLQSDERDRARAALRSMVARLGDLAETGAGDPRAAVAPYVSLLLALRDGARADKRWADSDRVRDGLAAAGVEVRDTPAGTEWELR
ncbi:MAG TPA: hypothetical protein VNA12_07840 [Mycobacteriales bacterium]|nr:hypothetical protein [Mycobacteriales bacterium]